jgi:hypothetical protein
MDEVKANAHDLHSADFMPMNNLYESIVSI